jgi:hypothetical protein
MAATLKRLVGEAGAGQDESHGSDRVYDVLKELAVTQNALVAALNQFITDYNASTSPTTASAVTGGVTVE